MKKKVSLSRTVTACVICFIVAVLCTCAVLYAFMGKLAHGFVKLSEIDYLVRNHFLGELSNEDIENSICEGYISALNDKYASYLETDSAKEKLDSYKGKTSGIGITAVEHPDTHAIYVISVSEASPADNVGLETGDSIIAVGEVEINADNFSDCFSSLKGKIGDRIDVTVLHGTEKKKLQITVSEFELQTVFSRRIGDYGYIRIAQFYDNTVDQFKAAVDSLVLDGVRGLIFDVTQNGGGTVDSVSEILDYLLPKGVIISVEYAGGKNEVLYTSDSDEIDLPMTVITDGRTASAAELFAISIRDYEKGVLIGHKTYGKGVMQTTYKLDDGSSVKFTVAKFYGKNMTDFNGKGIEPDYEIELSERQSVYLHILSDEENPYIRKAVEWLDQKTR